MVGEPTTGYSGGDSSPLFRNTTMSLLPSFRTHLRVFIAAAWAAALFPAVLFAQSQFAGTYFGSVNTQISAGPISTESALGVYQAVITSDGAIDVNGVVTGTVDAAGIVTFNPEPTLSLVTGSIVDGTLRSEYGNLVGNGTTRFRLNASTSFTPSGSAGSSGGSGGNGGGGDAGSFQNGSFEIGPNPGAAWITMATGRDNVTGWVVTGGTVDYIGTAWQGSNGTRSLDLSGLNAGTVSQTFTTTPGESYTVDFDFAGNPGYGAGTGVKTMRVSVDNSGASSEDFSFDTTGQTLGNMGWTEESFTFVASAASTTLSFQSFVESAFGPAIDNVRVNGSTGDVTTSASSDTTTVLGGTAPTAPRNLTTYRNKQGQTFEFTVTGASTGSIWGTDVYTDDSSVAKAAVHAGVLAVGETKTVTISILAGQDSYAATTNNGITSSSWGRWSGSYSFSGGSGASGTAVSAPQLSVDAAAVNIPRTFAFGTPLILSVPVSGIGPFTYQWFLNSTAISGATSATYSLPRLTAANAGNYSLQVTNSVGSTTIPAGSVSVSGSSAGVPQITLQPLNKVVAPGGVFALATSASGASISYQWFLNGTALSGENGPVILRTNVNAGDVGDYTVRVTNSAGSITSESASVNLSPTASVLRNLSIRTNAAANQVVIPGFVISGTGTKRMIIRAIGPGLDQFGLTGTMDDPELTVWDGSTQIAANDSWDGSLAPAFSAIGAFPLESGSADAAILVDLPAASSGRSYTVQVKGANNSSGLVLIEVYDADTEPTSKLVNGSVRTNTAPGADVLTLGFVLQGTGQRTLLVRGIGPTLAEFGVPGTVSDPQILISDANPRAVLSNDNWGQADYLSELVLATNFVGAFSLSDQSADSAALSLLDPGAYTIQVSGANDGSGEALAEIYEVP